MSVKYEHLVAGLSGGAVSTLILHPFDLLKIRFAVNDNKTKNIAKYTGLRNAVKEIVRTEGLKGLYRGMLANVLGSGSAWGLYFFSYNTIKTYIQGDSKKSLGMSTYMLASAPSGLLCLVLINPLWVVKTRLCVQHPGEVDVAESKRYRGIIDAFRKIYRTEGIRGLYKGFVPGMFGVTHGTIQFVVYEEMKKNFNEQSERALDSKLAIHESIMISAASKMFAAATTYPYQVVRARLQDHHHDYKGTMDCINQTWRGEGWRGFYKGLGVNILKVTPATVLTFLVYENMYHYLNDSQLLRRF